MDLVVLENEHGAATISPRAGASLRSLRIRNGAGEFELLSGGDQPPDPALLPRGHGSFIMAPWPNRIRDGRLVALDGEHILPVNSGLHAIHGTVRQREWTVTNVAPDCASMEVELEEPWPYSGRVIYEAALDGPALRQSLTIEAGEDQPEMPAGFGWHPWFRRNLGKGNVHVKADVEAMWVLDEDVTPTGEVLVSEETERLREGARLVDREMDGCFRLQPNGSATLRWPEAALQIESSGEVSHLMVYSPEHAICMEPQTCTVNAFQLAARGIEGTGTASAAPGSPLQGWTRWSWK